MLTVDRFGGTEQEWDTFARAQSGYTHFHRLRWRDVIQRVFGHECIYLAARSETGALVGILPLVRVKSMVFGHFLVSMPFLNYGGPLGSDEGIRALVDEVAALARRDGVKLLELRSRIPLPISLPVSHRKVTVVLDLPSTPEALFKKFESNRRTQIRRAQKAGVTVKFGHDQLEPFFRVFAQNMRDLGTPTQPVQLFRAIAELFGDDVWFMAAYHDGQPVAGACGFRFGDEFEMTWVSALRTSNQVAPNMQLYWACMERAIHEKLKTFNFGRCSPGGGTHRFKLKWGGREEPLWWYGLAPRGEAITPSPNEGVYRLGPRVWSRLPTRVATALGPMIVRYIP